MTTKCSPFPCPRSMKGWYSSGSTPDAAHITTTKQVFFSFFFFPNPNANANPNSNCLSFLCKRFFPPAALRRSCHTVRHRIQLLEFTDTPLFLLLDSHPSPLARELPLGLFETVVAAAAGEASPRTHFVSTGYTIASDEAERIGKAQLAACIRAGAGC